MRCSGNGSIIGRLDPDTHRERVRGGDAEREREREIYARRPCIVLQRGIVGRVPWCKDYTDPLPLGGDAKKLCF